MAVAVRDNRRQTLEPLTGQLRSALRAHILLSIYIAYIADARGRFALCNAEARALVDLPAVIDATVGYCASRALSETADKLRLMRPELASSAAEGA